MLEYVNYKPVKEYGKNVYQLLL